jgi:uncharacterized membrane protein
LTKLQKVFLAIAAIFFTSAGVLHFLKPAMYMKIMPPYIPWHAAMVAISGAAEIAGGLGLLVPSLRRAAALGLVALLVAVFPANVYMATNPVEAGAASFSQAALWGRLLLQPVFIWWVLWCSKPALPPASQSPAHSPRW